MARMQLGLIVGLTAEIERDLERIVRLGLPTCQLSAAADRVLGTVDPKLVCDAAKNAGIAVTSCFLGFQGQFYNRDKGPATMGLVAPDFREVRVPLAKRYADFVAEIGVDSVTCHVGFIPNDEKSEVYKGFIEVQREVALHCRKNGQQWRFETGQELPSTLRRAIEDIDTGNLGVNLDPANLILYGMANPLDAAEILGPYVRGMHAKDGVPPNRDEALGMETPLGEGEVEFDLLIPRLAKAGFRGPVTIEREISGPEQERDVQKGIEFLQPFLGIPD